MSASGPSGPLVHFSFFHSYIIHIDIFFLSKISQQLLELGF